MHDIRWIRDNVASFDRAMVNRAHPARAAELILLDDRRKAAVSANQTAQERRKALSKEIGKAMGAKDLARADALKAEVAALKETAPALERAAREADAALNDALAAIPNLPQDDVPVGRDETGNVEKSRHGAARALDFTPRPHWELGEATGEMDFETAAKISGARFTILTAGLARLHRAIGQFMLDLHVAEHGYTEVDPPLLVKDAAAYGTANLPKFAEDLFRVGDSFWLIPTAEVSLTNIVRERVLEEGELPKRFTALTPCFRSEAGSAGRDTRGMLRQHQFAKVELVSVTTPEASAAEHERMLACAEAVLKRLDLHYRVITLCTGDMGFASARTWDIEVWLPGAPREGGGFGAFREISSCSVCGDFQARRMNARYRPAQGGAPRFVHTLNGSGVAVGRALIAVMETWQNPDGSITVPPALTPYMGGRVRIGGPHS